MEYRLNSPDVVQEELDGEVIVVHLISGSYYSLTKGGAAVWKRLIGGQSAAAIVAHLVETTLGSPAEVAPAVEQFVADLVTEQLIVRVSEAVCAVPVAGGAGESCERGAFEVPGFDKFTDMQELLLVDPIHEVGQAGWPLQPAPADSGAMSPTE